MENILTSARAFLKDAIDTYGEDFGVRKYQESVSASIYRQSARTWAAAVVLKGQVVFSPSIETLSAIGADVPVEGMITVTKVHLDAAFVGIPTADVVTNKDQVEVRGSRYRVTSIHTTGELNNDSELVLILFDQIGKKDTPS